MITRSRVASALLALLAALVAAYLVAVFVGGQQKSVSPIDKLGGTRFILTARIPPDEPAPSPAILSRARETIASRVNGLGVAGSQVTVEGDGIVVTMPGDHGDEIRDIGAAGRLYLRPVIVSIPAQPNQPAAQPLPATPRTAERIAQEKNLRQSTNPSAQQLDLQFEATRCGQPDVLAGNDDPALPLVTCSTDKKNVYLLGPSILGNDQINSASARLGELGFVVDLKFTPDAVKTWADYTAAHIGAQVAFALDTVIVSAPAIRESIPNGRVEISGGDPPFTESQARHLANELSYKPLPLSFNDPSPEAVPPKHISAQHNWLSPPVVVIVAAFVVLALLVSVLLFQTYRWVVVHRHGPG